MPYTPSGGYYTKKRRITAERRLLKAGLGKVASARIASRLGPPKTGKYAVLICFDGPQAKLLAEQVHKYLTGKTTMINQKIVDNPQYLTPQVKGALLGWNGENIKAWPCSVALHDCQKHPLNHGAGLNRRQPFPKNPRHMQTFYDLAGTKWQWDSRIAAWDTVS